LPIAQPVRYIDRVVVALNLFAGVANGDCSYKEGAGVSRRRERGKRDSNREFSYIGCCWGLGSVLIQGVFNSVKVAAVGGTLSYTYLYLLTP
jgi:hypothetical protein